MKNAIFSAALAGSTLATGKWSTSDSKLFYQGEPVVLHGFSTTCGEYLLRGIGTKCWVDYQWDDPANLLTKLDHTQVDAMLGYLKQVTAKGVKPALRFPMTGSYWLGIETNAARENMQKYPNLSDQYQTLISNVVDAFTAEGVVVILDLHWNDDDSEQQEMALQHPAGSVAFWESVASKFGDNDHVFYELYNEPHIDNTWAYMHGDGQYTGMLDMAAAVRKHSKDSMLVIAGAKDYAYDADSLAELNGALGSESNVIWNFHPYMGQYQAGDWKKNADGFQNLVRQVQGATQKPVIITEFGQFCCDTNGGCYDYSGWWDGRNMGYVEAILTISEQLNVSWTPWSWRPEATDYEAGLCQDVNAQGGLHLAHPTDGKGADWATLWPKFSNQCQ